VFAIDYRHSPQWQWPTQFEDTQDALEWIVAHGRDYGADVTRLALIGRSAGAQLALLAAYAQNVVPVRAVVSYYGAGRSCTQLSRPAASRSAARAHRRRTLSGRYAGRSTRQRYAQASPISYAARAQPPTLLVYGGRDNVIEVRFAAELDERLRASGNVSVLLVIPWAEHAFDAISGGPSAQLALYNTERFLAWALYAR
jgi:acetyl esterase/lipase